MHRHRANLDARARAPRARRPSGPGRRADDVLLIGVSKTVDVERIRAAMAAGVSALGENRVQEAKSKVAELGRPAAWHLIGHLQTNKVKDALELFDVIHSIDRLELAREVERRAAARGQPVDALLQVNVAAEASKGGCGPRGGGGRRWTPSAAHPRARARPHDHSARGRASRKTRGPWFRTAARAGRAARAARELSMGMSGDFEVAVEEGATMVRVGTAIFGPRRRGRHERQGQAGRLRRRRQHGRGAHPRPARHRPRPRRAAVGHRTRGPSAPAQLDRRNSAITAHADNAAARARGRRGHPGREAADHGAPC